MLKYIRTSWLHVVLVILAVFLDGGIAQQFAGVLFKLPMSASPYLSILVILMPILTGTTKQIGMRLIYIMAFLSGLLFDIFYVGIIGIATIGFPLTVWLATKIQRYVQTTMSWSMVTWFLSMCAFLFYDYFAFGIINLANSDLFSFVVFHLFPTIVLNLIFFIVLYSPLSYLYRVTKQPDISSYNTDQRDLNSGIPLRTRSRHY
ncbi:rod shape-determining protein MreD [Weissella uvarum]|uniref:rod shape-determining protein MreD n=1 Tax=Weissella uvarum TaxID=1479233 RepID=UPI00195FCB58|nr:rod shape-determining protein MreD [Weissella uvarum]MBM7617810.1 rod shape-determining protein MreD [Weissella uvarum]MCM0595811.1 rod shape-determining protein MreD [Weissella uvarum]